MIYTKSIPVGQDLGVFAEFIAAFEGQSNVVYDDSKGLATIGTGFNLLANDVLCAVLAELGVFSNADAIAGNPQESLLERNARYQAIVDQFHDIVAHPLNSTGASRGADEVAMQNALEAAAQTYNVVGGFSVDSVRSAHIVRSLAQGYTIGDDLNGAGGVFHSFGGYQAQVNARLATRPGLAATIPANSYEYLALLSLQYSAKQTPPIIGTHLLDALASNNRAEAWYEIRYQSNADDSGGIAKRRFQEAEIFGLASPAPPGGETPSEFAARLNSDAIKAYQMYTNHRAEVIFPYELAYGNGQANALNNQILRARIDYKDLVQFPVQTLEQSMAPAFRTISETFLEALPIARGISVLDVLVGTEQSDSGSLALVGTKRFGYHLTPASGVVLEDRNELLLGLGGNDALQGKGGNDVLFGGAGSDTYVFDNGDGNDYVVDWGAENNLLVNGNTLSEINPIGADGDIYRDSFGNLFVRSEGYLIAIAGGDVANGTITLENFDFADNSFGLAEGANAISRPQVLIDGEFFSAESDPLYPTTSRVHTGTALNDNLNGGFSGDTLGGGGGDDLIKGFASGDTLRGDAGADQIDGGDGDDSIIGGAGSDFLSGDADNDTIVGHENFFTNDLLSAGDSDVVDGGLGNDALSGGDGDDVLSGGIGRDALHGGGGRDVLIGGASRDVIFGDSVLLYAPGVSLGDLINPTDPVTLVSYHDATRGYATTTLAGINYDDVIDGGDGNDIIFGEVGNDFISGGSGNDLIEGDRDPLETPLGPVAALDLALNGNDIAFGGAGDDWLYGNGGDDELHGGADSDHVYGQQNNDSLSGDAGADWIYGGTGNDFIDGGADNDMLFGEDSNDTIEGGAGVDTLDGGFGQDVLVGGADDDTLHGGADNDTYLFAGNFGNDTLDDTQGVNELRFDGASKPGDLTIASSGNNRLVTFGSGSVTISQASIPFVRFAGAAGELIKVLSLGTVGSDIIEGFAGPDEIRAGAGNDVVHGNAGDDVIDGEAGNDTLQGGEGNDTYRFLGAWGTDTVLDIDGVQTLEFPDVVAPQDLRFALGNGFVTITAGVNTVQIDSATFEQVGTITIAGGVPLDEIVLDGSAVGDTIIGSSGNDRIHGGAGNDTIRGGGGNDKLFGDADNDQLFGDGGEDQIFGGAGDDLIDIGAGDAFGSGGNDRGYGEAGNDHLVGLLHPDSILDGGADDDLIEQAGTALGGDGNDVIFNSLDSRGQAGEDEIMSAGITNSVMRFERGDGHDYFRVSGNFFSVDTGDNDVLILGAGLTQSAVTPSRSGNDLILDFGNGDVAQILEYFNRFRLESIQFADGSTWSQANVAALGLVTRNAFESIPGLSVISAPSQPSVSQNFNGGSANDSITFASGNDTVHGGAGNDRIYSGFGVDDVSGDTGDDDLYAGGGDDTVHGGDGNDLIFGGSGNDSIFGELGDDQIFGEGGNDVINTGNGTNVVDGGDGNDSLTGGNGADVLVGGAGNDTLNGLTGDDLLMGGSGGDLYNFAGPVHGNDRIVNADSDAATTDRVFVGVLANTVVLSRGASRSENGSTYTDLKITLSSGSIITVADFLQDGAVAASTIDELAFVGVVWNRATIFANLPAAANTPPVAGDDVFETVAGTALVIASADLIANDTDAEGNPLSVSAVQNGVGGTASLAPPTGDVTFTPAPGFAGNASFTYSVSDGTSIDSGAVAVSVLEAQGTITTGTSAADVIATGDDAQTLLGLGGNDTLSAGGGDDLVLGGTGNDTLNGGSGDDTLSGGSGNDVLLYEGTENGGDTVSGGSGFDVVQGSANDDVIGLTGFDASSGVERIDGGAGVDIVTNGWSEGTLDFSTTELVSIERIEGDYGNDVIIGSTGADVIVGGSGDDTLSGGSGNDVLLYEGTENGGDTVSGGSGFDVVQGSANDDVIGLVGFDASNGVERIDGGAGVDIVTNGWSEGTLDFSTTELVSIERIEGDYGNDVIIGSTGADVIVGGSGDDTLSGGSGNDVLLYEGTENGGDTVSGGSGFDVVQGSANDDVIGLTGFDASSGVERIDGGAGVDIVTNGWSEGALDFSTTELVSIERIEGDYGNDVIIGSTGADVIVGGSGDDTLSGGSGNDVLLYEGTENGGDTVSGGSGFDVVQGSANDDVIGLTGFDASSGVERIDGGAGVDIVTNGWSEGALDFSTTELVSIERIEGDYGNDVIIGSTGADVIVGGSGDDTLSGGSGNDVLLYEGTENGGDTVSGGSGFDVVQGSANDDVIGLTGFDASSGVERIDGGAGVDIVTNGWSEGALDFSTTELVSIERIEGDYGNDVIIGSTGADVIVGGSGDDTLSGGSGDDVLRGNEGHDTYRFAPGSGSDTIDEQSESEGEDVISFEGGIAKEELWFSHVGDDLVIGQVGRSDVLTIAGWYDDDTQQVEHIQVAGYELLSNQVDQLVAAMAAFAPPTGVGGMYTQAMIDDVAPVVAAAWQAS